MHMFLDMIEKVHRQEIYAEVRSVGEELLVLGLRRPQELEQTLIILRERLNLHSVQSVTFLEFGIFPFQLLK